MNVFISTGCFRSSLTMKFIPNPPEDMNILPSNGIPNNNNRLYAVDFSEVVVKKSTGGLIQNAVNPDMHSEHTHTHISLCLPNLELTCKQNLLIQFSNELL